MKTYYFIKQDAADFSKINSSTSRLMLMINSEYVVENNRFIKNRYDGNYSRYVDSNEIFNLMSGFNGLIITREYAEQYPITREDITDTKLLYKFTHYNKKCIVKGCTNRIHDGEFVGDICFPCYSYLTTGHKCPTNAFWNNLVDMTDVMNTLTEALKKGYNK